MTFSYDLNKVQSFIFKRFYIITRSPRTHLPLPSSPSLLFFTGKRTKSLGPRSPSVSILNFIHYIFYHMTKIPKYNQSNDNCSQLAKSNYLYIRCRLRFFDRFAHQSRNQPKYPENISFRQFNHFVKLFRICKIICK